MPAHIVFTRLQAVDRGELETSWAGIRATMDGHPIKVLAAYGEQQVLEGHIARER